MDALIFQPATELAAAVRSGAVSAQELVEAHIRRIEQVDGSLNAVVVRLFEQARCAAAAADAQRARGDRLGPLHGVPVTVKECFDLAGTAATLGIRARAGDRATTDAPLVTRLRQAGAIILGKTNVAQLLMFVESDNAVYGRTNNPWNLDRSAGGSSGGEGAIIAAGGSALGLGTDIGGSLRVPAHFNGICSLKPTAGRLPASGSPCLDIFPGNEAIPDSAGPLARAVADVALAYSVLAAPGLEREDRRAVPAPLGPPPETAVQGLRIGVYEDDGYFPVSAGVRRVVREAAAALQGCGAVVESFRPPAVAEGQALFYALLSAGGGHGWKRLLGKEKPDPRVGDLLQLATIPDPLRPLVGALLRRQGRRYAASLVPVARRRSASGYLDLIAARDRYRDGFAAAVQQGRFDALLCPPNALPAFTHGASRELAQCSVCYTALYNLLGWPAGVVPVTRVRDEEATGGPSGNDPAARAARRVIAGSAGLPLGVQIVAQPWREDVALTVMAAVEAACRNRPDYPRHPPL